MPTRKFFSLFLFASLCTLTALIFSSLPLSGLAAPLLQSGSTPVYLPFIAKQSGATEWTQHAHDAQRTSFTQQVVPTPWRLKWIWNGPDGQGKIAAGSDGVFALSEATGAQVWQRSGIGSINSTAAYDADTATVFVVSANGRLYKLHASDGQVLDQFNSGQSSTLPLPPAVLSDRVLFSMGNSVFAVNKHNMEQIWRYDAGSPVDTPPAYSPATQTVVVASRDLYVHAIDSSKGAPRWRVKPTPTQPGDPGDNSSFAEVKNGWPVIAEQHGLVFIRYRLHWQSIWNFNPNNLQNNSQIRQFFLNNRSDQPLFALRLSDGSQAFIPNVGNGGFGDGGYLPMGPMPVIARLADGKEAAYIVVRAGPCAADPCDSRYDSHLGEMMLDGQTVSGFQAGDVRFMQNTFFPTDEQPFVSMAGDMIFAAHWEAGIAHQITDRSPARGATTTNPIRVSNLPHIATSQDEDACGSGFLASHYCASGLINTRNWPGGFYIYWKEGAVYDRYWSEYAAWLVSNDTIYFVSTDGAVVALEHGQPAVSSLNVKAVSVSQNLPAEPPVLNEPISHEQAHLYAGWVAAVEGELVRVFNNGKAVYLSFVEPHQRQFVVRIMKEHWGAFDQPPETPYRPGQRVQIRGQIGWYQGGPVIYVTSPEQIVIEGGE
jgi:hypothetical protein